MPALSAQALAYVAIVLAMFLWGSSFALLKYAFGAFSDWWVIWARMALGAALALACWKLLRGFSWRWRDLRWVLLLGLAEPCLYFVFETNALRNTTTTQAGMIVALLPLMIAVSAWIVLAEALTRRLVAGLLIALCGALLMTFAAEASAAAPRPLLGNLYQVGAMLCATVHALLIRHLRDRYSPFALVAAQNLIGALFFLPLALGTGAFTSGELWRAPLLSWLAVLYLGFGVSFGAFFFYTCALRYVSATRASIFINLVPVFAVILGVVLLGEVFSAPQVLAACLILGGVLLSQWRGDRGSAPVTAEAALLDTGRPRRPHDT